jgi:beta-glucanase (GH16 family)
VTSTEWRDYTVEFVAPPYTDMAEFAIEAKDARALVDSTSLTERAAIVQTEPIPSRADSYVPAGYSLVFNDEFNGSTLNRQKWFTRYIYNGGGSDHLNDERQHYRDNDNHVLKDGVLSLVARKVSSKYDGYESGMIRSDFTMTYGYLEARVKMPGGKGVWAAFWLNSDVSSQGRLNWPPEFDIFEFVYNGVEDKLNMLHSNVVRQTKDTQVPLTYNDAAFNTNFNDYIAPFNFNDGFHTVGTEWTPDGVTVYVDGLKLYSRKYTWTYSDGVAAGPAHILLNLAIGGSWAGRHGIDDSAFPQALQIDWVRAYQKK